ncbi:MAG: hypothetical protein ABIJ37_07240 [Pseudomonadota bacterium]
MDIFLKSKRVLILAMVIVLLTFGCATLEEQEARYGSNPPVIAATFAKDRILSGDTWEIYINAFDVDGDMDYIICTVYQDGRHSYPTGMIKIDTEQKGKLSGYLYLTTYGSFEDLWNVNLQLYLYIVDKAGHSSNEEVFQLRFTSKASDKEADKTIFDDKPLGPIMVSITKYEDRGLPGGIPEPTP